MSSMKNTALNTKVATQSDGLFKELPLKKFGKAADAAPADNKHAAMARNTDALPKARAPKKAAWHDKKTSVDNQSVPAGPKTDASGSATKPKSPLSSTAVPKDAPQFDLSKEDVFPSLPKAAIPDMKAPIHFADKLWSGAGSGSTSKAQVNTPTPTDDAHDGVTVETVIKNDAKTASTTTKASSVPREDRQYRVTLSKAEVAAVKEKVNSDHGAGKVDSGFTWIPPSDRVIQAALAVATAEKQASVDAHKVRIAAKAKQASSDKKEPKSSKYFGRRPKKAGKQQTLLEKNTDPVPKPEPRTIMRLENAEVTAVEGIKLKTAVLVVQTDGTAIRQVPRGTPSPSKMQSTSKTVSPAQSKESSPSPKQALFKEAPSPERITHWSPVKAVKIPPAECIEPVSPTPVKAKIAPSLVSSTKLHDQEPTLPVARVVPDTSTLPTEVAKTAVSAVPSPAQAVPPTPPNPESTRAEKKKKRNAKKRAADSARKAKAAAAKAESELRQAAKREQEEKLCLEQLIAQDILTLENALIENDAAWIDHEPLPILILEEAPQVTFETPGHNADTNDTDQPELIDPDVEQDISSSNNIATDLDVPFIQDICSEHTKDDATIEKLALAAQVNTEDPAETVPSDTEQSDPPASLASIEDLYDAKDLLVKASPSSDEEFEPSDPIIKVETVAQSVPAVEHGESTETSSLQTSLHDATPDTSCSEETASTFTRFMQALDPTMTDWATNLDAEDLQALFSDAACESVQQTIDAPTIEVPTSILDAILANQARLEAQIQALHQLVADLVAKGQ